MLGILDFWRGYKTKILGFLIQLTALALALGYITGEVAAALTVFFGGTAAITLRQGMATEVAAVMDKVTTVQTQVAQMAPAVANVVAAKVVTEVKAAADNAPSFPHISRP